MKKTFIVALAGNPNSGKSSLFNALTGLKQSTGNWPGVTVEIKTGQMHYKGVDYRIIDLPGTYSLSPHATDEAIARDFLVKEKPDVVVNVADITNPARNMALTLEIIETGIPTILAFNMMDVFQKRKGFLDANAVSAGLGIPCILISATRQKNISALKDLIEEQAGKPRKDPNIVPWFPVELTPVLDREKGWFQGIKELEQSEYYRDIMKGRRDFIADLLLRSCRVAKQHPLSEKVDRILTNKWTGLPIFGLVMFLVFQLTFSLGGFFVEFLESVFSQLISLVSRELSGAGASPWLTSLIGDGIIGGVGGILVFLPNIILLFTAIALLEDSGYIARAAFVMDGVMKKAGLNGRAFVPMVMGFGCNVPAIMATRTLQENREKLLTILINPFMSCGARLPIYILFAGLFFQGQENIVTFSLYVMGILVAILMGTLLKKTVVKGHHSYFIIELPEYKLPHLKNVLLSVVERTKDFIIKAGTIIFAVSVVLWVLLNFNFSGMAEVADSFAAQMGGVLAWLFRPLGFGTWESAMAILGGIMAKEAVVSNFAIIYGFADVGYEVIGSAFTAVSAYSFMVFTLLYTPCAAVIGVIRRETGSAKWTLFSVSYQLVTAWVFAFLFYTLGTLIGLTWGYLAVAGSILLAVALMNRMKSSRNPEKITS